MHELHTGHRCLPGLDQEMRAPDSVPVTVLKVEGLDFKWILIWWAASILSSVSSLLGLRGSLLQGFYGL